VDGLNSFLASSLRGYAQVYFSRNLVTGVLFLAASFVYPIQGLVGLLSLLLANVMARQLGLSETLIQEGYFALNALLVGLLLGYTYRPGLAFLLILVSALLLSLLLSAIFHNLFWRFLGISPLCLPFVLTSWITLLASSRFPALTYTVAPYEIEWLSQLLPLPLEFFSRNLAATFFQFNVPGGLLIAVGLLWFSRQAFLLASMGIVINASVLWILGQSGGGVLGFNAALTAIAVGGIWVIPGPDSLCLALLGAVLCSLVTAATEAILQPIGLPVLAFPFVATTSILLLCLRQRVKTRPFQLTMSPAETPEKNVKRSHNLARRGLVPTGPAFFLPVHGTWSITQGVAGQETHKGLWAHAWDFEVLGSDGLPYRQQGTRCEDYFSYRLPVFAPGSGKVVRVVGDVPDNGIGQTNQECNWGNLVILRHQGDIYSALCHLTPGSIEVHEGEEVTTGQLLGRVGSSGRSPIPHLHFQAQRSPEVGSPTLPAEFLHYCKEEGNGRKYIPRSVPKQGELLRSLSSDIARGQLASFPLGASWKFHVTSKGRKWQEIWTSEVDFLGTRTLHCAELGAVANILVDRHGMVTLSYQGPPECGLAWFSLGNPRIPFTNDELYWNEEISPDLLLGPVRSFFYDLIEPYWKTAFLEASCQLRNRSSRGIVVETRLTPKGKIFPHLASLEIRSVFLPEIGLASLSVQVDGKQRIFLESDSEILSP
jgi:urea transporter